MNDITELLKLNLEIEGLLRILDSRDSDAATERLGTCFCEFSQKMNDFLLDLSATRDNNEPAEEIAEPESVAEITEKEPVIPATLKTEYAARPEQTKNEAPVLNNASLLKSFTLNDRFRFRRELFAGNDDDFNETLQLIADMESYTEAEDYLLNDMMWDRENPAVADFLEILANSMPR